MIIIIKILKFLFKKKKTQKTQPQKLNIEAEVHKVNKKCDF